MKTDDLVLMLATGAGVAPKHVAARRYTIALGWGMPISFALMLATIGLLSDIRGALALSGFWIKLGFVVSLAAVSLLATLRLSRPGADRKSLPVMLSLPVVILWGLAVVTLVQTDSELRIPLLMGQTWAECPGLIAMLSLPIFVATLWAIRGLAPTNLRLAGGSAGLFAGAAGASIYTLHCPEMDAPFIAVWYLSGILIPAIVGLVLGSRLLRWGNPPGN